VLLINAISNKSDYNASMKSAKKKKKGKGSLKHGSLENSSPRCNDTGDTPESTLGAVPMSFSTSMPTSISNSIDLDLLPSGQLGGPSLICSSAESTNEK
jgi:hypothetical protein